jgi:hypothetical protein
VSHLGPLRHEVPLVLLGDRWDHRHSRHHGNAVALEPDELGRVVGHQLHCAHAHVPQNLERRFDLKIQFLPHQSPCRNEAIILVNWDL